MIGLSSTLLPVPDGPSSASVSPSCTVEIHAVEHHLRAEALGDAAELDHCVSSSLASRVSSSRISTELVTTAPVVDLPTPSAPCWVLKPR